MNINEDIWMNAYTYKWIYFNEFKLNINHYMYLNECILNINEYIWINVYWI